MYSWCGPRVVESLPSAAGPTPSLLTNIRYAKIIKILIGAYRDNIIIQLIIIIIIRRTTISILRSFLFTPRRRTRSFRLETRDPTPRRFRFVNIYVYNNNILS